MPTPGWVPEPAKTRPGHPAVDVRGAEGPGLQEGVREGERRAEVQALGPPVVGGHEQLLPDVGRVAAGLEEGVEPLAHRPGLAAPVDAGTGVRHRFQHVERGRAVGGGGGVGHGRHGDEARRVGHQLAAVDDRLERAVPVVAEVDVVVAQVRARATPRRRRARRPPRARSRRRAPRGARRRRAAGGRRRRAGRRCRRRHPRASWSPSAVATPATAPSERRRISRTSTPRWIGTPASVQRLGHRPRARRASRPRGRRRPARCPCR